MTHAGPLVATLVVALALAFAFGFAARLLRLPPLLGYIAAGIAVGPHTPGFVADASVTSSLAEIGVALLLFAVGLHFRARDLVAVWRVAVPGALAQVAAGTLLGAGAGVLALGLGWGASLVFGLALAISSTAVATRALEEKGRLSGEAGRIALGWLVMQDLIVVVALVLLPTVAGGGGTEGLGMRLAEAAGELVAFLLAMALGGRVLLPRLLALVAATGSRELFTLAVIATALGTAFGASALFGVSPALGAFFAGVLLGESPLGHQAAAETVPLQRVFVALFFVSVGMLVEPEAMLAMPFASAMTLVAVMLGTGGAILGLLVLMRVPVPAAASAAGAMTQIGEFSFLLGAIAIGAGILPNEVRGPILVAATLTILATPLTQALADRLAVAIEGTRRMRAWLVRRGGARLSHLPPEGLEGHAILVGHGRVGRVVAAALRRHGLPHVVIETDHQAAEALRAAGVPVVWGDATRPEVLKAARPEAARLIVLGMPDASGCRRVMETARAANPAIIAAARAHDEEEAAFLEREQGVGLVVMGEREIALGMADYAMARLGVPPGDAARTVEELRESR
ncbi:cation:proton antiporter [Neoroseomonas oryzicola]|uniref:Sodium:proton antiporter n=1 Tax=Neoroseomonas oryzicola TaxID=535904 RepID=A0A9X9WJP9_9PROT|nr:cation:proton antiporter [Neoroseomonas oryzicola]MBR0660559.1 sodium:proton antiporter [Neoroseomonas oryzicola]NKE16822.1 sodium:proton antiporter [Neoroseomonas oryzicola]